MAKKKTADSKSFSGAIGKFAKDWKTARNAKPNSFGDEEILPKGDYHAQVSSCRVGVTKANEPYFSLNFVLIDGVCDGKRKSKMSVIRKPEDLEFLTKDIVSLGYEVENLELEELEELATSVDKEKPHVKIHLTDPKEDKNGVPRQSLYINGEWEEDAPPQTKRNTKKK